MWKLASRLPLLVASFVYNSWTPTNKRKSKSKAPKQACKAERRSNKDPPHHLPLTWSPRKRKNLRAESRRVVAPEAGLVESMRTGHVVSWRTCEKSGKKQIGTLTCWRRTSTLNKCKISIRKLTVSTTCFSNMSHRPPASKRKQLKVLIRWEKCKQTFRSSFRRAKSESSNKSKSLTNRSKCWSTDTMINWSSNSMTFCSRLRASWPAEIGWGLKLSAS